MTLCVLGMSQEFKNDGIAVNGLWPKKRESVYRTQCKQVFPPILTNTYNHTTYNVTNVLHIPAQTVNVINGTVKIKMSIATKLVDQ